MSRAPLRRGFPLVCWVLALVSADLQVADSVVSLCQKAWGPRPLARRRLTSQHQPQPPLCFTQRAVSPGAVLERNHVCVIAQSALRLQHLVTTLSCVRFRLVRG